MNKPFYERNKLVIDNPKANVCFEELLNMTPEQFREWVIYLRKTIVKSWDENGCPLRTGKDEEDIIYNWNKLGEYPVHKFTHTDELSDIEDDVIINKSSMGSEVDQFFPNMMQVRINYTQKDNGYSVYDLVADDKYLDRVVKGSLRHFRRDSMYNYSRSCMAYDSEISLISTDTAMNWIESFFDSNNEMIFNGYDFWLEQVTKKEGVSTGYSQVDMTKLLQLTREEVQKLYDDGKLEYKHHSTFDIEDMPDDRVYSIRLYEKGQRIFPAGFKAFRIGYIQVPVNFPPATAKYLYERYTDHLVGKQEVIKIYDPSSGWGGRILGAMSVRDDGRKIHYIGTDPNPDNIMEDGTSKYQAIADFYNTKTTRSNPFFSNQNTYEVFQHGSEEIANDPAFQKHKGDIDLVFTSPPYFNREAYSEDENQSYKKYGDSYESWKLGFLEPTLKTAVEWLKPGGYLLWNIADLLISGEYLPLEDDSKIILESLGMEYKYVLKMAMASMPGQHRLDENGIPKCKNYCKVNGRYLKYEPIFVFQKPLD